jgi:hypothetical protein
MRVGCGWLKCKFDSRTERDNEEFKRYYQWCGEMQWWVKEKIEALQLDQLRALVKYTYVLAP